MGATIAYMCQVHCYDLCSLRSIHPGHRMYYMDGLAQLLFFNKITIAASFTDLAVIAVIAVTLVVASAASS